MVLDSMTGKKLLLMDPKPTHPDTNKAIIKRSPTRLYLTKYRINPSMAQDWMFSTNIPS